MKSVLLTALGLCLTALGITRLPQEPLARYIALPAQQMLSSLSGRTSLSLGEAGLFALLAAGTFWFIRLIAGKIRGKSPSPGLFPAFLCLVFSFLLLGYALLWTPIARTPRMPVQAAESGELVRLASQLGAQAGKLYPLIFPSPEESISQAERALETLTGKKVRIKAARWPELLKALHLSGVYLPWTGESLVRDDLWNLSLPFVAAHEGAHQLGFGGEGEASCIAYLACSRAGGPLAYSAALYMLHYCLQRLAHQDPMAWVRVRSAMDYRVIAHLAVIEASLKAPSGPGARSVQAFARLTGQTEAICYDQAVDCLLACNPFPD